MQTSIERERERNLWGRGSVNLPKLFLMLASPFSSGPNDCHLLNALEKWLFIVISKITDHWNAMCSSENAFSIQSPLCKCMRCQSVTRTWAGQRMWTGMDWTGRGKEKMMHCFYTKTPFHLRFEFDEITLYFGVRHKLLWHTTSWFTVECNEVVLQPWALLTLWTP